MSDIYAHARAKSRVYVHLANLVLFRVIIMTVSCPSSGPPLRKISRVLVFVCLFSI